MTFSGFILPVLGAPVGFGAMQGLARLARGQCLLQGRMSAVISSELGPSTLTSRRLEHAASQSGEGDGPWAQEQAEHGPSSSGGSSSSKLNVEEEEDPHLDVSGHDGQRRTGGARQNRSGTTLWPVSVANVSRRLTRQDVVDFFQGCNLTLEEVRVQYSQDYRYTLQKFWCNFPTGQDRSRALQRHAAYLGSRRVVLQAESQDDFKRAIYSPLAMSSRGRYVMVSNLADSASSEDVLRFFQGYNLHAKSVTFVREHRGQKGTLGQAVVRFDSPEEAQRAVRSKQGGFCINNPVQLQVLV